MKLQKQVAYRYKDTIHYKYIIIVPEDIINKLRWKKGQELKFTIDGHRLIVEWDEKP